MHFPSTEYENTAKDSFCATIKCLRKIPFNIFIFTIHLISIDIMFKVPEPPAAPAKPQIDLNVRIICQECRDPVPNIIEDFKSGDLVCGNCGLVLGNRIIDTRSEWRTFNNSEDNNDDPSRVGGTTDPILGGDIDSTVISSFGGALARDLNKAHQKTLAARGEKQHLVQAFREIQAMCERIDLSRVVIDSAKQLFKKVEDEKLLKGKTQEAIMASCIYLACREQNVTRTFKEIYALTKVSKKEIGRCYKILRSLFENPTQQVSLDSYISRFSSFLDLPSDVQKGASIICKRASELGTLAGKSPISLVASCLYFVSTLSADPKSAKEIADCAGCTEATLKNAYRYLYESRHDLVNTPEFKSFHSVDTLPPP